MDLMASKEDNYYDLAIVDPPYGIGESGGKVRTRKKHNNIVKHKKKNWDDKRPNQKYFDELFRVSHNQIIWGGNYFVNYITPSMGWIYWHKMIGGDFSEGELAYTSFDRALKRISFWSGNNTRPKIHPTEKPVFLYKWLLKNYAKEGDKILDTHGGSMSSAIACHDYKFDLDIIELDEDYYRAGKARFDNHIKQLSLF